ncbi:ATPases of the AAA+ class [Annulohypoxylon maeteangense]|uniref:ATPases of the AAA+ class n=1 Tax=Annulohypoxylon maeteangense TaxID=1927788 RepID=UPI002008309D|nr:ATPases of the AAA+ class [Annulohypoxylon maeteangense]KAI0886870.1 ATPases of the AAA+ class [Annulohypoxylon maeteangense]
MPPEELTPGGAKAISDDPRLENEPLVSDDEQDWAITLRSLFGDDEVDLTTYPSPFPTPHSEAKDTWERIKKSYDVNSKGMESIMNMLGIEEAKLRVVEIAFRITTAIAGRGVVPLPEELCVEFKGNLGVGKKSIADHYVQALRDLGVCRHPRPYNRIYVNQGGSSNQTGNNPLKPTYGYLPTIDKSYDGVAVTLVTPQDNDPTSNVVKQFIPPMVIYLQDFAEYELYQLFVKELSQKFEDRVEFQGFAINGLPVKILIKRIAKNQEALKNGTTYAIKSLVLDIIKRQHTRLFEEIKTNKRARARVLTQEDLLGPPPSRALEDHPAWKKLNSMIGLESVKTAVKSLILQLHWNYNRELAEQLPVKISLNRVFLGNPGTGKTTVAKLYAEMLAAAGFLSTSEVMVRNPSDFLGTYFGESENITREILAEARGKVLVIDEAYMLGSGDYDSVDSYRTAVIDTLVGEIQGDNNEDRCVLLLGYREQMQKMFRKSNPGLARRFPMSSAFQFEDYTKEEIREILELKLAQDGLKASDEAKQVAMEVLERARNSPTFANAGEVDILLTRAKERQHTRLADLGNPSEESLQTLEPSDMDKDFNRIDGAAADIKELFSGMIGTESLVEKLQGYQKIVKNAKELNLGDPREFIPFNYIFRGPPGTGKTTTARKMGRVFYDIGFTASAEIVECSVSDLIGKYIGQTGPKVRKVFEKSLGKVLLIDEAYRLSSGSTSSYASEAVGEIISLLTQERYKNRLVVILAGYHNEMNKFLATNPGLSSRFPDTIDFKNLTSRECRDLLFNSLRPKTAFDMERMASWQKLDQLFKELSELPFWGNARDIETLVKNIMSTALMNGTVGRDLVSREVEKMLEERRNRARYRKRKPAQP